ncbi:MAG TPA: hypothetical protein VL688_03720 [Verrucomicrobiae bacterium]|jgi:hypothetical protein|nr:hypothetical protein [Verrucomicrobiae bacterium]
MEKKPRRKYGKLELEITEFREDPSGDAAFGVFVDVKGPGPECETVIVYFMEDFMNRYFKIRWNKNVIKEERRIEVEKRALFTDWALLKVEDYIKGKAPSEKIYVDFDTDGIWAEKVEKGLIKPQAQPKGEHVFVYNA